MVLKINRRQAATNMERATSAGLRWYVRDHRVTANKNEEIPCEKEDQ